jgi:hypothetical protein
MEEREMPEFLTEIVKLATSLGVVLDRPRMDLLFEDLSPLRLFAFKHACQKMRREWVPKKTIFPVTAEFYEWAKGAPVPKEPVPERTQITNSYTPTKEEREEIQKMAKDIDEKYGSNIAELFKC